MSIQDNIISGLRSGGGYTAGPQKNTPSRYSDRQTAYFAEETDLFIAQYAKYASDYQTGELQYFDENGNSVTQSVTMRFANVVNPSAAIQRHFDDYKNVLFDQRELDYIQPGSKLTTMGSVWLAYNPDNISSTVANSIFRRCNAVWNHLDYFGNVVLEPIVVEPERANASTPDVQNSQRISTGYYNVICQYNDFTRQINDNTRLVLGSKTYGVSGYGDFSQEFTGDYSTVHVLNFTIRVETKNEETDDMVNHVAEGLTFDWKAIISGLDKVTEGKSAHYSVISYRNGEDVTFIDNPPVYTLSVSDTSIATVNGNVLTAIQPGTVTITATLTQNPSITATKTVTIISATSTRNIRFISEIPESAQPFTTFTIQAGIYDPDGTLITSDYVDWTLSGADETAYAYTANQNTLTVSVYGYSETPLTITASKGLLAPISANVQLCGW